MQALTVAAGVVAFGALEAFRRAATERIDVTRETIFLPHWPAALDGLRVVVASDLHVHPAATTMGRRERRLADVLAATDPDILVAPGDLANTRRAARVAVETLRAARPRYGTFISLGNGEHKRMSEEIPVVMELQQGGHLLINDSAFVRINEAVLWVLGVDDPSEDRDRLDKAARGLPEDGPKILLAHSPEIVTRLHRTGIDLVVCGHTHGGQVCPPGGKAIWTQTQTLGRSSLGYGTFGPEDFAAFNPHPLERTRMYVSRGIGTAKMPVRAFCRPEVAVLELRGAGEVHGGNSPKG